MPLVVVQLAEHDMVVGPAQVNAYPARKGGIVKRRIFFACLAIVIVAQLVPVERGNPHETAPLQASAEVVAVLERSCYDCHSNRTVWPWYAYIAPVSWLVAHDVSEGRDHLNFSQWEDLSLEKRSRAAEEITEEVSGGEMPLAIYRRLHPAAAVSGKDLEVLRHWARSYGAQD